MRRIRANRLTAAAVACLLSLATPAAPLAAEEPPGLAGVSARPQAVLASVHAALRLIWSGIRGSLSRPELEKAGSPAATASGGPIDGGEREGAGTVLDPDGVP